MQWWNDNLYVGTNRAWRCAEAAALNNLFPLLFPYPPQDPDIACAPQPEDLPLQAEIWRWTPATDTWERVYQSPNDVPIPGQPGKFVARDIGYRGMSVFTEPDGTEALYVSGVNAQFIWYGVPPPRILRSTDGLTFEPLPQAPGSVLGDFAGNGFRGQASYNGRFYIIGGDVTGSGALLEAADPAGGNNNFRVVSPPGASVMEMEPYNGFLYLGLHDAVNGYSVIKTDASGTPPYSYTTVVEEGGYLPLLPNLEILSLKVFNNRLYAGGNGLTLAEVGLVSPAELIRINPDDTWDLVVGAPRDTPAGMKNPISGFDAGFGNFFNWHMWRMEVFDDNLLVGTLDGSTTFKDDPNLEPILRGLMGFDLYRTPNGTDFYPITTNGFGDEFNFGLRGLEATPHGLFLGTANYYYGLQIWRGQAAAYQLYLPVIARSPTSSASALVPPALMADSDTARVGLPPPSPLQTELVGPAVLVSWEPTPGGARYRVLRSEREIVFVPLHSALGLELDAFSLTGRLPAGHLAPAPDQTAVAHFWTPPVVAGITTDSYFVDRTAIAAARYVYTVEAFDAAGQPIGHSNLAPAPSAMPPPTFQNVTADVSQLQSQGSLTPRGQRQVTSALTTAQSRIAESDWAGAVETLSAVRHALAQEGQTLIVAWRAEDLARVLVAFERRVRLAQLGLLQPEDLY